MEKLKQEFDYGLNLRVKWIPDGDQDKHGEIIGETIYVYNADLEGALKTLKHEYLDYVLTSEAIKPLTRIINFFLKELIEKLVKMISSSLK